MSRLGTTTIPKKLCKFNVQRTQKESEENLTCINFQAAVLVTNSQRKMNANEPAQKEHRTHSEAVGISFSVDQKRTS